VLVRLTESAERLIEQIQPPLWEALRSTYGGLSKSEIQQMTRLLRHTLVQLEK